jgi:hypothetical protein
MPNHDLGDQPSDGLDGDANELHAFEVALRGRASGAVIDAPPLGETDQIAKDIADIERATAVLRKAEPALETWTGAWPGEQPATALPKPRPVWLLIGLLWLSTALVTVGAVAAIAALAG